MKKTLLWLDDIRNPNIPFLWVIQYAPEYEYNEDGDRQIVWVKNYKEFTEWITENGLPTEIGFDHDLSDFQAFKSGYPTLMEDINSGIEEKTGMDCAKWLIDFCMDNNEPLPKWFVQSANPTGAENINSILNNYTKFQDK